MIIANIFGQELDQIKLANEYYQSKEYDKAADVYKKLSKQKNNIPRIYSNYIDLMINNDEIEEAYKYINYVCHVPSYDVHECMMYLGMHIK